MIFIRSGCYFFMFLEEFLCTDGCAWASFLCGTFSLEILDCPHKPSMVIVISPENRGWYQKSDFGF